MQSKVFWKLMLTIAINLNESTLHETINTLSTTSFLNIKNQKKLALFYQNSQVARISTPTSKTLAAWNKVTWNATKSNLIKLHTCGIPVGMPSSFPPRLIPFTTGARKKRGRNAKTDELACVI